MTTEFNQFGVHEKECSSTHWSLVGSPVITQLKTITSISQESISANVCQREERTYEALWLVNLWQFFFIYLFAHFNSNKLIKVLNYCILISLLLWSES